MMLISIAQTKPLVHCVGRLRECNDFYNEGSQLWWSSDKSEMF